MRANAVLITGLLFINAIQLVSFFFLYFHLSKKYKRMQSKFVMYLDTLDRENQRLKTGNIPEKARKEYGKLLKD